MKALSLLLLYIPILSVEASVLVGQDIAVAKTLVAGRITVAGSHNIAVAGAAVTVDMTTISAVTDQFGKYELSDVPPGKLTIRVKPQNRGSVSRVVTISPGQPLTAIDFVIPLLASLSGRVIDDNNRPVPGVTVWVLKQEYFLGSVRSLFAARSVTDSRGHYVLADLQPGRQFALLAEKWGEALNTAATEPDAPRQRPRTVKRTLYPNAPDLDTAIHLTLSPGEERNDLDIRAERSLSYCVEGRAAFPSEAPLELWLQPLNPTGGVTRTDGGFAKAAKGSLTPGGKFRVCGLGSGQYRFIVTSPSNDRHVWASVSVTIRDRDDRDLVISPQPAVSVPVTVRLLGEDQSNGSNSSGLRLFISLTPLTRQPLPTEELVAPVTVPSSYTFEAVAMDQYVAQVLIHPDSQDGRIYVKSVSYNGVDLQSSPLDVGSAVAGTPLLVSLATDGGYVVAKVGTGDAGVPDISVVHFSALATTESAASDSIQFGRTDQFGRYRSTAVAPGKRVVFATREPFDGSTESCRRLWQRRSDGKEVEVPAGGSLHVVLPSPSER